VRRRGERVTHDALELAAFTHLSHHAVLASLEPVESHSVELAQALGVQPIGAEGAVEVDVVAGLGAAGLRQRAAQIGPALIQVPRLRQLRDLLIPAVIVHRVQDLEVEDGLGGEAEHDVSAQKRPEHQRRVAARRVSRDDQPIDVVRGDQATQRVGRLDDRFAALRDAAVIPGLTQIAHEQPFRRDRSGRLEELEGRHADLAHHSAEGDQQGARVAAHVEAQGRVRALEGPAKPAPKPALKRAGATCGGLSEFLHRRIIGSVPPAADDPLRVLMVMHMPASRELGGARVQLELADELRASGCEVQILDRGEILGGRRAGRMGVSPAEFAAAAVRRVREIARDYDVIDAHQGNLPVSKRRLGFDGLLVTRSVGLVPFYKEFARTSRRSRPETSNGRVLARPMRRWRSWRTLRQAVATLHLCDLIIVPNADELAYLTDRLHLGEKTVVLPLGIAQRRLEELGDIRDDHAPAGQRVAFIGDWTARKGAHDWPEIIDRVHDRLPAASFAFLGTHVNGAELRQTLSFANGTIDVVPSYTSEQLGGLLEGVRAGALPSYIEGLGLGVLEKMAAGIPSVCYDVPGPRETIGRVDRHLLVPAGDTDAFAARLVELLELDEQAYLRLSAGCRSAAEQFSWRLIARYTLAAYRERLTALRASVDAAAPRS
jgi:glycosyltransferase involved in cell wall biosynthesis